MKLRNRLLALACLLLFLTLGGLILLTTGPRKPFAVILFVADNINPACLTAARIYSGGGESRFQVEEFPNTALCRNSSADHSVPDIAAAATELASGKKCPDGFLGQDPSGTKLTSLLEEAAGKGRSTGLITTGDLSSPSAAAFFAKTADSSDTKGLLEQFLTHPSFDIVVCSSRAADQELTLRSVPEGTDLLGSPAALENFPFWKRNPVVAQFPAAGSPAAEESTSLSDLVRIAIRRLELNRRGYLLVVDDQEIGSAASSNDGERMLRRITELDKAVGTARRYAGENAVIVLAGRVNIGGLQLSGQPLLRDKGVAIAALSSTGHPSLSWSTGPGFAMDAGQDGKPRKGFPGILSQPSAIPLPKALPTSGDVLATGMGQGTERIRGFLDLTDIHRIINESL